MVRVEGGQVWTEDSIAIARPPSGRELRDGYLHAIQDLTLGLVRGHEDALYLGPPKR